MLYNTINGQSQFKLATSRTNVSERLIMDANRRILAKKTQNYYSKPRGLLNGSILNFYLKSEFLSQFFIEALRNSMNQTKINKLNKRFDDYQKFK